MSTFIDNFGDEREFTAEEAYTVYYNAISRHGCNNNAAAAADKRVLIGHAILGMSGIKPELRQ